MSEAAQTLEGWYALHDFRSVDWTAWRFAEENERSRALDELQSFLAAMDADRGKETRQHGRLFHRWTKSRLRISCICAKR